MISLFIKTPINYEIQEFEEDAIVEDIGSGIITSEKHWQGGTNYLYLSITGHDELAEIIAKKEAADELNRY